ncbi:ImmA/IrrE family metallo-endopeptidase [Fusobacterium necrophorum]|uniref:ImmA/IrrE family metallo-endopeptidase n=2 Tax=Fusobacterium necrophorum TaxID=859 RepID=UPI00078739DA|nr:ImmA/IrrE family metallo-endopeptidase [Fusobacterium necrophorum]KYM42950.1 hypothetical protein A2U15_08505 [Fusobacterium necrophorum subsp. funduliforme]MDK4477046.1 ImmA/IrrE family metallo-endopeptidase [Fusobacterium necrophorum]MDK4494133.1 ImmA/IrrE family metallo-endopeptidase [Fusobacterium necrophorum]
MKMVQKIINVIEKLKETYGTTNPFVLCQHLDIHIDYSRMSAKGMYINSFGFKNVVLNSELQGFSKYFTLAHELWHAIEDNGDDVRFFKDYTFANIDIYETKANTFAAYLLLDEDTDQFNIENLDLLDDDVKKELERFIQRTLDRNQIIF